MKEENKNGSRKTVVFSFTDSYNKFVNIKIKKFNEICILYGINLYFNL